MKYAAGRDVFLYNNVKHSVSLLEYFKNAPPGSCILRGIVLQEITNARAFGRDDKFLPSRLFDSGIDALKKLHKSGVIHGDVLNHENALVVPCEEGKERPRRHQRLYCSEG